MISERWRDIKWFTPKKGYAYVTLKRGNKFIVSRLVLIAFVGDPPPNTECCHNDGDTLNNNLNNLRWGTKVENTDDKRKHCRLAGGERHGNSKLTNAQVLLIREMANSHKYSDLAEIFGVAEGTIGLIKRGKSRTDSSHAGKGLYEK